jgi:hypothetical protein
LSSGGEGKSHRGSEYRCRDEASWGGVHSTKNTRRWPPAS